ncbi:MAG: peptidase S8/S53 subtilisin kexin sedolisin [Chlorobi bacterium OLB7]|nr:MAG: peptidase S8/S53 subtilisin kexin sedolisin [Chlorobi bacterium OLB7]
MRRDNEAFQRHQELLTRVRGTSNPEFPCGLISANLFTLSIILRLTVFFSLALLLMSCDPEDLGHGPAPGWSTWRDWKGIEAPNYAYDLAFSPTQGIWIASASGIFFFDNPTFTRYDSVTTNGALSRSDFRAVDIASDGSVWAGATNGLLARFNGTQWQEFPDLADSLYSATITAIQCRGDNEVWVGTNAVGLLRLTDSRWSSITAENTNKELPGNIINDIVVDRNNVVWVATDSGIGRFDGSSWQGLTVQTTNGKLPENRVTAVAVDSLNQLWAGTYRGYLLRYDGREWLSYAPDSTSGKLPGLPIISLAVDGRGVKWIGFELSSYGDPKRYGYHDGGVMRFDDIFWKWYSSESTYTAMPGGDVVDVEIDAAGKIWMAILGSGISSYRGE